MNTISDELNRWDFDKITTSQWITNIKEELKTIIQKTNSNSEFFYNSETTPDNIIGDFLKEFSGNKFQKIITGYTLEFFSITITYNLLLKAISDGHDLVQINFNQQKFSNTSIIDFLKLIENISIHIQIYLYNDNPITQVQLQNDLINFITISNLKGSLLTLINSKNFNTLLKNSTKPTFNLINIDGSELTLEQMLSIGVKLINEAFSHKQNIHQIEFTMSVEQDFFYSIAKIRALKFLWFKILQLYHWESAKPLVKINTVVINKCHQNVEYKDVLSATTKTMAALMGGSDQILISNSEIETLTPMSEALLTIPLILKYESDILSVSDPAYGSFYIENLSLKIAENTWVLFNELEKNGGYLKNNEA